jgi:hypothetical protein
VDSDITVAVLPVWLYLSRDATIANLQVRMDASCRIGCGRGDFFQNDKTEFHYSRATKLQEFDNSNNPIPKP